MLEDFKINIPSSMTPRPGERVIYYRANLKHQGTFHGYDVNDQSMVKNESGSTTHLRDFVSVRLANPNERNLGCYSQLPASSVIYSANDFEKTKLEKLLNQHIRPGPKYFDLIEEIWSRGYEVFLVGGSVRDVLNGDNPNDVDLVSTIPFFLLSSIAESMFGTLGFSRHSNNGFMSIGYNAGNKHAEKGTLIDVKNFFSHAPGTEDAEFGANIEFDHRLRDFACNAVYFDPINSIFIDPSGHGIEDARNKRLNIVNDPSLSHPVHRKAHIAMRMFKFMHRDYSPSEECLEIIRTTYEPMMDACSPNEIWRLFYRSILGKAPEENRTEIFWYSKKMMIQSGFSDMWNKFLAPREDEFGDSK